MKDAVNIFRESLVGTRIKDTESRGTETSCRSEQIFDVQWSYIEFYIKSTTKSYKYYYNTRFGTNSTSARTTLEDFQNIRSYTESDGINELSR